MFNKIVRNQTDKSDSNQVGKTQYEDKRNLQGL